MLLYTIGFTKKSAERFFGKLAQHKVECLVDIRVHPGSQLSGFAKGEDLAYFLKQINSCDYRHLIALAPTEDILTTYRADHDWDRYVSRFEALMDERNIPAALDHELFTTQTCCLLCSEATPDQCHRRLVAERLARAWPELEVKHLV